MPEGSTKISAGNGADAGPKARLLTLSDLDRRTMAFRKANDLISQIETDLGGHDSLSTAERQIVQRAALTGALLEDLEAKWLKGEPIDPGLYATLGNAQRRLFETVGLKRKSRDITPTVSDYVARIARGA
jgi:hypothetical protein